MLGKVLLVDVDVDGEVGVGGRGGVSRGVWTGVSETDSLASGTSSVMPLCLSGSPSDSHSISETNEFGRCHWVAGPFEADHCEAMFLHQIPLHRLLAR